MWEEASDEKKSGAINGKRKNNEEKAGRERESTSVRHQ
jgi:hypothetical protein